jgi:PHS family inorganic phosphate transporter-like MFS transporter
MLAAVFLMQPIGQFLAYIVGYAALVGITRDRLPNWTSADWDDPANRDIGAATIVCSRIPLTVLDPLDT